MAPTTSIQPYSKGMFSKSSFSRSQTLASPLAAAASPATHACHASVACADWREWNTTPSSCHMHARMKTRRERSCVIVELSWSIAAVSRFYVENRKLTRYLLGDLCLETGLLRLAQALNLALPRHDAFLERVDAVARQALVAVEEVAEGHVQVALLLECLDALAEIRELLNVSTAMGRSGRLTLSRCSARRDQLYPTVASPRPVPWQTSQHLPPGTQR